MALDSPDAASPPPAPADTDGTTHLRMQVASTAVCALATAGGWSAGALLDRPLLSLVLFLVAYAAGGWDSTERAVRALRERSFDVDLLMLVAAGGAALLGHWLEGAVLLFLFSLGNTLETHAFRRTRHSIRSLMELRPATARVMEDGTEREIPAEEVLPGTVVRVRPGERIPVDGVVVGGGSAVDESTLTGEAVPVRKGEGAEVFAGTMNGTGFLDVRSTRAPGDTTLARVIRMVEEAREARAPTQGWIEAVESRYAAAVLLGALLAAVLPVALLGWTPGDAFYRAMTLLVVASPCALVISIPATVVSAVSNAARHGVLFKGGAHLDALADVRVVALDKTGTLTRGRPEMVGFRYLAADGMAAVDGVVATPGAARAASGAVGATSAASAASDAPGSRPWPADEPCPEGGRPGFGTALADAEDEAGRALLGRVASVESRSEHHIARAVVRAAEERGIPVAEPEAFRAHPGEGVEGVVDGVRVWVGRLEWVEAQAGASLPRALESWPDREIPGGSPVHFATDHRGTTHRGGGEWGVLAVADPLRPGAADAIRRLREGGVEKVVILTGDAHGPAEAIAREVGVDSVRARLLPDEKAAVLSELREAYGPVLMVGDGVNDAPALAAANVSAALGAAGTDVALETADVVVMGEDLSRVAYARRLSQRTRRVVRQNLFLAGGTIAVLVVLALTGTIGLPTGVLGHEGSTVVVVMNGLRLLRGGPGAV